MTNQEQVLSRDNQAKAHIWGSLNNIEGWWVKGRGWETKITYSEDRAWELALAEVFGEETSCRTDSQYV